MPGEAGNRTMGRLSASPRELDGVKFLVAVVYLAGAVGNYDSEGAVDVCLCRSENGQSSEVKDVAQFQK